MAKRKSRKTKTRKKPEFLNELYGLGLIIIAILGIGRYGPVGEYIASFALFLFGNLYVPFLILLIIIGALMAINRDGIDLFSSKLVGVYLFVIGITILLHQTFVIQNLTTGKIMTETFNNIVEGWKVIFDPSVKVGLFSEELSNTGGGMIGALLSSIFYKLLKETGTVVVTYFLLIAGIMLFTSISIKDLIQRLKEGTQSLKDAHPIKSMFEEDEEEKEAKKENNIKIVDYNEEEKETKKVVHDIKELTATKEEVKEEPRTMQNDVNKNYKLPSMELLLESKPVKKESDRAVVQKNIVALQQVLKDFGIMGKVVGVNIGPTVTQYEMELESGTRVSKLLTINKEISLALAKKDIRIQAPIPGKSTVGIEMPNEAPQMVTLRETLEKMPDYTKTHPLSVALGKDIMGKVKHCDIDKTPHLLVAGATGSGKSVCVNDIIISILMKARPDEVKLILVDPKKVELGVYNGVPHLATPVVTDPRKASIALKKAVVEMEDRYRIFEECKTKNIVSYNEMVEKKNAKASDDEKLPKMPYMVVIVDELADLMLVAGKEVEDSIMRITQMARAAGIHLIIATQRPSTDVITGLIKANIPSRISFAVSSSIDSRTILDMTGAEKLLGKGDMLFLPMGESQPDRIQGAFVSEDEIKKVVDYVCSQQKAIYDSRFDLDSSESSSSSSSTSFEAESADDEMFAEVVEFVVAHGSASASLLQRKFKLGYNRAARMIDLLEERGIIGPPTGNSKPREVLVKLESNGDEDYDSTY